MLTISEARSDSLRVLASEVIAVEFDLVPEKPGMFIPKQLCMYLCNDSFI